jgi:hypothetical protein
MSKKTVIIAGLTLAAAIAGLWFWGRPALSRVREQRALARAKVFMAKGDYRGASLSARQTLRVNPGNIEACRIMAELSEFAHSPHALEWRRRIVDVAPTLDNKLMLASTALHVQGLPYPMAAQMLDDMAEQAKNLPAYHVLRAELALRSKKPTSSAEAAAQFAEASRLEPGNEMHQLNLAVLRLRSTDQELARQARATLERLQTNANIGPVALRWLVSDSLSKNDLAAAERFSSRLMADSRSTFDDRLQHLGILRRADRPNYAASLLATQKTAATNAAMVYSVTSWMIGEDLAEAAQQWITRFPAKMRGEQPVPLALVDCYSARKDWSGLDEFLQGQKWGDLDFLRYAFLSHAASEDLQDTAANTRWRIALQQAGDRLGAMAALLSLASLWKQDTFREELLWQIIERFPNQRWAFDELDRHYQVVGNTRGMNKLYAAIMNYDPANTVVKNNYAATALLLNINSAKAREIAKELYAQHPNDPMIVSTYAYALHAQGQTRQGLALLEKLKPAELEKASVPLYYGLLLRADGQTNKAARYFELVRLELARSAPPKRPSLLLLPEEKELLPK